MSAEQVNAAVDACFALAVVALVVLLLAHLEALALAVGACTELAQAISPRAIGREE